MSQRLELALPIKSAGACLNTDAACGQLRDYAEQTCATHSPLKHTFSLLIDAVKLKDILGQIHAKFLDSHGLLLFLTENKNVLRRGRAVHPINWKKKYGGLMPSEMKRLKQLEEGEAV